MFLLIVEFAVVVILEVSRDLHAAVHARQRDRYRSSHVSEALLGYSDSVIYSITIFPCHNSFSRLAPYVAGHNGEDSGIILS
jgi:hypothetical protein